MNLRDIIATRVVEAGGRLTVRSALNPVLWLCAIVTIPTLVSMSFTDNSPTWMVMLAISPVAAAILGFLFLLIFDRDKLQSEDYQLRKRSLELIEQKGDPRIIDAASIEIIANPEAASLNPSKARDGQ